MKHILRPPLAVLVAVVMASCARLPDDIPPERTTGSRERLSAYEKLPADRVYRVLPDESVLRVLVGRAGPLAAMGHQHVVTSRDISGAIFVGEAMEDSRADLLIPVRFLRVDEKEERGRAYTWAEGRSLTDVEELDERYEVPDGEDLDGCAVCHL